MFTLDKTETETAIARFQFGRALEYVWQPGREYSSGNYVRPSSPNGFEYECTSGGQTDAGEPRWPKTVASTVSDGSVTWTTRAFGTNGTDTISSVNVVTPSGVTTGTATTTGTEVSFSVSGGTKDNDYIISVEVTTAGSQVLEEKLRVTIIDD